MQVRQVGLRSFRSYERATLDLGQRVTVVTGQNGAGKTNLLEALYFGCTGRSCRTNNERELVRFGAETARVTVDVEDDAGSRHELAVGFTPGQPKRITVDGDPVERLSDHPARPLVSVFLPERLDLIKGPPGGRRAHLDQVVAALAPARAGTRRDFGRALAQRNALLMRIRDGRSSVSALDAWDAEVAGLAARLAGDRHEVTGRLAGLLPAAGSDLGLPEELSVRMRGTAAGATAEDLLAGLAARRDSDIARGFTQGGPHRDDLVLEHGGRELRTYGSQGQQRAALLALLIGERELIAEARGHSPLLLLDDVFSELDAERRARLVERVTGAGQAVITATEIEHLPEAARGDALHIHVESGRLETDGAGAIA
ncbi:MAG: DNA replication and repair protein RecF [Baekduia sp.]